MIIAISRNGLAFLSENHISAVVPSRDTDGTLYSLTIVCGTDRYVVQGETRIKNVVNQLTQHVQWEELPNYLQ